MPWYPPFVPRTRKAMPEEVVREILLRKVKRGSSARRKGLERYFRTLGTAPAAILLARLQAPSDPLFVLFRARLSSHSVRPLLRILEKRVRTSPFSGSGADVRDQRDIDGTRRDRMAGDENRGAKRPEKPRGGVEGGVVIGRIYYTPKSSPYLKDPRYIDNVAKSVNYNYFFEEYEEKWEGQGRKWAFFVPKNRRYEYHVSLPHYLSRLYPSYGAAAAAVAWWYSRHPDQNEYDFVCAFYWDDVRGVIAPTLFSNTTAPRLWAAIPEANTEEERKRVADWGKLLAAEFWNALPTPFQIPTGDPSQDLMLRGPKVGGRKKGGGGGGKGWGGGLPAALRARLKPIVGRSKRAQHAVDRLARLKRTDMLEDVVDEFEKVPRMGRKFLVDLGKQTDDGLRGLSAISRRGSFNVAGENVNDWIGFFQDVQKTHGVAYRNEMLHLVGRVDDVVAGGMDDALKMALRGGRQNVQAGLGHFHAANHLRDELLAQGRSGFTFRFETTRYRGGRREVDIEISLPGRKRPIEVEIKTNLKDPTVSKKQIRKDLIRHVADGWEDLRYLYAPTIDSQKLGRVRKAMLAVVQSKGFQKVLKQVGMTRAEAVARLEARFADGMVGVYTWANVSQ